MPSVARATRELHCWSMSPRRAPRGRRRRERSLRGSSAVHRLPPDSSHGALCESRGRARRTSRFRVARREAASRQQPQRRPPGERRYHEVEHRAAEASRPAGFTPIVGRDGVNRHYAEAMRRRTGAQLGTRCAPRWQRAPIPGARQLGASMPSAARRRATRRGSVGGSSRRGAVLNIARVRARSSPRDQRRRHRRPRDGSASARPSSERGGRRSRGDPSPRRVPDLSASRKPRVEAFLLALTGGAPRRLRLFRTSRTATGTCSSWRSHLDQRAERGAEESARLKQFHCADAFG